MCTWLMVCWFNYEYMYVRFANTYFIMLYTTHIRYYA